MTAQAGLSGDPFLTDLYDQLHQTPMQHKLRTLAPMPVGVVFIEWPGMTDEDIRGHFRSMRELGFTCLKGLSVRVGTDRAKIAHMALDEGIIPWWYGEGGWAEPTPELLNELGIDPGTPIAELRDNETWRTHQEKLMRERIDREAARPPRRGPRTDPEFHKKFSFDLGLAIEAVDDFIAWLKETYGTVEAVCEAWNFHHAMIPQPADPVATWDDLEAYIRHSIERGGGGHSMYIPLQREYRRIRDLVRFKADLYAAKLRQLVADAQDEDPHAPFRAGGEMGLFLPFAARATDMEAIAEAMAAGGSFYPSIHLAWHFEEVDFEFTRPVYMQASMVVDWFKGGWSATWESTGGPQQLSGGKGNLYPPAADRWPSATVDAGVMTQLMLSYLAAGFRGFGLWCWNARTAGWEAGEFALLDRAGKVTERARQAGRIGQAAVRYRDELWQSHKEPVVGILQDFDNDAIWAAASVGGREMYKRVPTFARIGAARAMINRNVPFEHVTAGDLRAGLAGRYRAIVLPAMIALGSEVLEALLAYAHDGGRVVMDLPGGWYDEFGRLLDTTAGSPFEQLFGCTIRDYQYARNVPRAIAGRRLEGFVADLEPTAGEVRATYDTGQPAIVENACGQGRGLLLGWEASLSCRTPGDDEAERRLVESTVADIPLPYTCQGAICYRLAGDAADHYFLINDAPATAAQLDTKQFRYTSACDAVTGETVDLSAPIELPAYSGRWLRLARRG